MKSNEDHLNFFDTIRGVALMGVFLAHSRGEAYGWQLDFDHTKTLDAWLTLPFMFGATAVPIFFAISGFCIHLAHRRSTRRDWGTFFIRRFFRIYPPYLAALLLECLLFRTHLLTTGEVVDAGQFFSHLFLIHNGWFNTLYGINGSFWSIAVEVQLYLLYPLLFVIARKIGWSRTVIMTAVFEFSLRLWPGICLALHAAPPPTFLTQSPFAYWYSWAIGAWVAERFLNGEPLPFVRIPVWIFPVAVVVAGVPSITQPFFFTLASLGTVVVIARLLSSENLPSTQVSPVTRYCRFAGTISYSMYLIHQPFIYAIARRLEHTRFAGQPFMIFIGTLCFWVPILFLAWIFFRLLEQPSISLGKWVIAKFMRPPPRMTAPSGRQVVPTP